jgi:catechol 2,3-dioxygenase-like lactoylglutathione lyase family enzyme
MKRFHVHVSVEDLSKSITFYSTLFGAAPSVAQADYAKWMLDDPRVNFAISRRGTAKGIDHLGFQVDAAEELTALKSQLQRADASLVEEMGTTCCYAESDKYWVTDPQGIAWETFHSLRGAPDSRVVVHKQNPHGALSGHGRRLRQRFRNRNMTHMCFKKHIETGA